MSLLRNKIIAASFAKPAYRGLLRCIERTGVPRLWRNLTGRRHVILTFHRIRPADAPAEPFDTCPSISVDAFRQILERACRQYTVVSLRELCERRTDKTPLLAVTFDDGWRDNYDLAFPVLHELGLPATIFITTGKIGSAEPFWQQRLGRMFREAAELPESESARELRAMLHLPDGLLFTPELYRKSVMHWKRTRTGGRGSGIMGRESGFRVQDSGFGIGRLGSERRDSAARWFLSADEIREMASAGIAFGSHTVSHCILPHCSRHEIERELTESKAALENILGRPIDMLAYPEGQYDAEIVDCARAAGYRVGVTTAHNQVSQRDPFLQLPRIDVS